ncbi:hypothetical protein [Streptomyces sp. MMG1121]|uniref:hypothetical protein n=1 Tax=Streptomyces sp. MMG1121 TaxID=1415544 RepID=UPI0006B03C79|nr:hypothetical protein [Streptomyces sp. MMG1121]KOV63551.1 hypothetical protein ADK64_20975 [Streptomyces sp. MMG1121]
MKQLLFPNNTRFWYETLRPTSQIAYDGADFGEVVSTSERIAEGVIEPVEIPYEDTTLPGHLYPADTTGAPRPTLTMHNGFDGTADEFFKGRPEQLHDHLPCTKTLMVGTAEEGAGAHCHPGTMRLSQARVYNWPDDTVAGAGT